MSKILSLNCERRKRGSDAMKMKFFERTILETNGREVRVTGLLWTKLSNNHILSCSASLLLQWGRRRWRKKHC
ncbi:hypothetical protein INR49_016294 [Caranx melampygus]|nr:hypothetical protein INR49_016294 [Caranx melampygus]